MKGRVCFGISSWRMKATLPWNICVVLVWPCGKVVSLCRPNGVPKVVRLCESACDGLCEMFNERGDWSVATSECSRLDERYFPPYKIPTVPHVPWSQRNIPVLPSTIGEVTCIIKEKIVSGVYEPSMAAYCSRWLCVVKKDGKSLRLVHNLQLLNVVTI
jgi:hypothetical protein